MKTIESILTELESKIKQLQEQLAEVTELNNSQCGRINSDKEVKDMLRNEVKLLQEQLAAKEKELSEVKAKLEIAIKSCWNDND